MGISRSVLGFFEAAGRARAAQALLSELSVMSDEQLARRGISREDISRLVIREL